VTISKTQAKRLEELTTNNLFGQSLVESIRSKR